MMMGCARRVTKYFGVKAKYGNTDIRLLERVRERLIVVETEVAVTEPVKDNF
jgi:hypothetical protein